MKLIFFLVSYISSVIGSICGIGGGIIIKPTLDLLSFMNVETISFLSGCTVLSMSVVSLLNSKNGHKDEINLIVVIPLIIGAILGGIFGKKGFVLLKNLLGNSNYVGFIQSITMSIILIFTIYAVSHFKRGNKFETIFKNNIFLTTIIGLFLGLISSFLGIGGGPMNIIILTLFFLMSARVAALNNLFIIMFSQLSSLLYLIITDKLPDFEVSILILMVAGGIVGGVIGSKYRYKLANTIIEKLFMKAMVAVLLLNIVNAIKFYII